MNLRVQDYHTSRSPLTYLHTPTHPHPLPSSEDMASAARLIMPFDDVVFCVGKHRQTYHVNADSLIRSSVYFRNLLDAAPHMRAQPIAIDCEEGIFESLLLLMRYGTVEALPPMSASEAFRLKKEADFYGVRYTEPGPDRKSELSHSDDGSSNVSCSSPSCSSASGSPKSMMSMSSPPGRRGTKNRGISDDGRYYEGVRLSGTTPAQLTELSEFPLDLADPSRLLLVSCLDQEKAAIYTCDCVASSSSRQSGTQWAINFHHRHAFCTACGRMPNLSPKHFAEMFTAGAALYFAQSSPGQAARSNRAWRVSSDSTCTLRFLKSAGDGYDACGCSASGGRAGKEAQPTIWAANSFYSHAFCTCCGEAAKGPVLLSLLLAIRYGGSKLSRSSRSSFILDSQTTDSHARPIKSP